MNSINFIHMIGKSGKTIYTYKDWIDMRDILSIGGVFTALRTNREQMGYNEYTADLQMQTIIPRKPRCDCVLLLTVSCKLICSFSH